MDWTGWVLDLLNLDKYFHGYRVGRLLSVGCKVSNKPSWWTRNCNDPIYVSRFKTKEIELVCIGEPQGKDPYLTSDSPCRLSLFSVGGSVGHKPGIQRRYYIWDWLELAYQRSAQSKKSSIPCQVVSCGCYLPALWHMSTWRSWRQLAILTWYDSFAYFSDILYP